MIAATETKSFQEKTTSIMKYNKIVFGLGALAVSLASCSEDVEYTPAPAVNTPPIYFSIADESTIDLEESDTYFTIKAYRQNTSETATYSLDASVRTEDGSPLPAGLFRICEPLLNADGTTQKDEDGNVIYQDYADGEAFDGPTTLKIEFPAGQGESDVRIDFGGKDNLTEMLSYLFDVKVAGEASPYYITSTTYDVSYTPWINVDDNFIVDQTLYEVFTSAPTFEFNVPVQEHPIKSGLFRILAPYSNCSELSAWYQYDGTTPDYLYINATVPNEVYFSDSKGNPLMTYDTHIRYAEGEGFQEDYGWGWLECMYSHYLLKEDFKNFGGAQVIEYADFSGTAGQLKPATGLDPDRNPRIVQFSAGGLYGMLSNIPEYNGPGGNPGVKWLLYVDGATPLDWRAVGDTEYTDGFIGQYYASMGYTIETYYVPLEANTETPGVYRLVAPYNEGVWLYGTPQSSKYNVSFDISDPDFVVMEPQGAYEDEDGVIRIANAAGLFMSGLLTENGNPVQYTKQEVIEMGVVDKVENGVVVINNPVIITPEGRVYYLKETIKDCKPAKIVIPGYADDEATTQSVASKVAKASAKATKSSKPMRFVKKPTYFYHIAE